VSTEPTDYERGEIAGRVAQRLEALENGQERINGSVAETARALGTLAGAVEAMRQDIRMEKAAVVVKAATLESAEDARRVVLADAVVATDRERTAHDRKWSVRERVLGAVATLVALALAALGLVSYFG
jgi:hypothetical protein